MKRYEVAIFVDQVGAFGQRIIGGISRYIRTHEFWNVHGHPDRVVAPIENLARWKGDGIIVQAWQPGIIELVSSFKGPVVNVSLHMPPRHFANVLSDSVQVGVLAANHFIERGFRTFGFCGFVGHRYSELRREGFSAELKKLGFECSVFEAEAPQVLPEEWNQRLAELSDWLRDLPKPIAILACNDVRARHITQAAQRVDVRIPEEIALLGVDNDELICEMSNPPLSSVDLSAEQLGYEAAALLGRLMHGDQDVPGKPTLIGPKGVVTRRSTDILAISDPAVAQAVQFIREHSAEAVTVEDVVAAVPLSRRVLERRFRAILNRSVNEEIGLARIDRAKQLLTHADLPTTQIAKRCGFNYVQQFNAMFKRFTGMTPMHFRRQFSMK